MHLITDFHWQCGICKEIFKNEDTKLEHEKEAHAGQEHCCKCMICGQIFPNEMVKLDHIETCHLHRMSDGPILDPMTSSEQIILKEIDDMMEDTFISPMFKINDQTNPFQCSICPESFKFYVSLVCHIKVAHDNMDRQDDAVAPVKMEPLEEYPCDFCEATFPNNDQRIWHTKNSHGIENAYKVENTKNKQKVKLKIILKRNGKTSQGT